MGGTSECHWPTVSNVDLALSGGWLRALPLSPLQAEVTWPLLLPALSLMAGHRVEVPDTAS